MQYLNKTTLILVALAVFACGAIGTVVMGFTVLSWHNTASSLKNSYEMKIKSNSGEFDNLWKKIKQSAQSLHLIVDAVKKVDRLAKELVDKSRQTDDFDLLKTQEFELPELT